MLFNNSNAFFRFFTITGKYDSYKVVRSWIKKHYPSLSLSEDKYVFWAFQEGFYTGRENFKPHRISLLDD